MFTGLIDGSFAAYDDISLEQLWEVNVGVGVNAPPMTFEVGGMEMRNQTMLFVFGL